MARTHRRAVAPRTRRPTVPLQVIAIAGPVFAVGAALAFVILELSGASPLSPGPARNVAEAAVMGRAADVLRLLHTGADPTEVLPIRGEITPSGVRRASAFEAAVLVGSRNLVQLIIDTSGISRGDRLRLVCFARGQGEETIAAYLNPGSAPACTSGIGATSDLGRASVGRDR